MQTSLLLRARVAQPAFLLLSVAFTLFVLVTDTARAADNVIISEFAASNTTGLRDEDGAYSDWIEVFNGGTNTVNLNGWALTDVKDTPFRWLFPET